VAERRMGIFFFAGVGKSELYYGKSLPCHMASFSHGRFTRWMGGHALTLHQGRKYGLC
jgi:hypothetical protein